MEKTERARQFDLLMESAGSTIPQNMAESIAADYPYFLPLMVMELRQGDNGNRSATLALAASSIGNRADLYELVGERAGEFRDFYPGNETKRPASTFDAISHFLDTFGNSDEEETRVLEQRIFNPVPDYSQLLAKEEEKSLPSEQELDDNGQMSKNDLLINRFIAQSKRQSGHFPSDGATPPDTPPADMADAPAPVAAEESDPSLLSESLAKIYIRKHRYEKALEIIQSLSLNFPEKSIYFADQIRFLKKLILNEKYKQKNNS